MGRALDGMTRALERLLGRCAGLVPPGRRGWVEAVRAEAGEVPPGTARLGWLAGGLWLVAREAGMVRRIGYGLGIAAVAVVSALVVRYLWSGAHAGRDDGWDKARMLLLVTLLAGLPWVARRRGVFGPVGPSVAARAVRAGGSAALVVLVLDFARVEHFAVPSLNGPWTSPAGPWNWAQEAAALVLIGTCLAAVLIVTARRPQVRPALVAWCAVAAGLVLFFMVAPVQVLVAAYAAGLLAVTSRRSPVTPATMAISAGIGAAGGLLIVVMWDTTRTAQAPGLTPKTDVLLLFVVLILTITMGTGVAALAAHRANGTDDPAAVKARARQYLAAGPLTAASAALMLPLFRASHAVHYAAVCPAAQHSHCTAAPAVWVIFLVAGPLIGLAMGTGLGSAATAQPPRRPPPDPPREPIEPPPDGSRSCGVGVFVKI
jgi:hypothetical protein